MQSKDWYIREHESYGDNYLSHKHCSIEFNFELSNEFNKNDQRINMYKNTTDLVFIMNHLKDGERTRKMKMFGVNLDVNQLEDLIKNTQECLKKLKLNSF
jgi:hypothetical protein